MIKALYVPDYKEQKYGPSFQRLVKYADAANFAGEKVSYTLSSLPCFVSNSTYLRTVKQ